MINKTKVDKLATQIKRSVTLEEGKEYKLLGLRLYGKGLFHRETKERKNIKANKLFMVKEGDFIYSRLFGWRGAFAIVPKELDSYFVSGEFPTFEVNENIIRKEFLLEYFLRETTLKNVENLCLGRTKASRNRFKEQKFLNMEIKIKSIEEQKILLEKLNKLEFLETKISMIEKIKDDLKECILYEVFENQE